MTRELPFNLVALQWLRPELDTNLQQARVLLEQFVDEEITDLAPCLGLLHQVQGAIQVAQANGAAVLADELQQVAAKLDQQGPLGAEAAAEALMFGLIQLSSYLERIAAGEPDIPLQLMSVLNDLRAARDAELLAEAALLAPEIDTQISAQAVQVGSGNPDLPAALRKLRGQFHQALLTWYRDASATESLTQILRVLDALEAGAGTPRLQRLFRASSAFVAGLREGVIEPSVAIKKLFGKIDRVFKQVIDQGEEAAAEQFPTGLFKSLLFYLAQVESSEQRVLAVKEAEALAQHFSGLTGVSTSAADGELASRPDQSMFDAVGTAIRHDIAEIKDHLESYLDGNRDDWERLHGLLAPVHKIAETLGLLGRGDLRTRLVPHHVALQAAHAEKIEPEDQALMDFAGDLLFVDAAISTLGRSSLASADQLVDEDDVDASDFASHQQVAVAQMTLEMAKVREAILNFLHEQDLSLLSEVPAGLHFVEGALRMLEQDIAARLLSTLQRYWLGVQQAQIAAPDGVALDAMADLFSGAEYYIEGIVELRPDRERALQVAEAAMAALPVPESELEPELEQEPDPQVDQQAELAQTEETAGELSDDQASTIDPEILEIFLEEAAEELAAIDEHFARWQQSGDDEALARVRRAFHTLKGGGRLIGVTDVGDFAASVEHLLNRVIDGAVSADAGVFTLVEQARAAVSQMLSAREHNTPLDLDVDGLQESALRLSQGLGVEVAERADSELPDAEPNDIEAESISAEPTSSGLLDKSDELDRSGEGELDGLAESDDELDFDAQLAALDEAEFVMPAVDQLDSADEGGEPTADDAALAGEEYAFAEMVDELVSEPSVDSASEQQFEPEPEPSREPEPDQADLEPLAPAPIELEPTLYDIFCSETDVHLEAVRAFIQRCRGRAAGCAYNEALRRALHTLHGSARTAEVAPMAALAGALENWVSACVQAGLEADQAALDLLMRGEQMLSDVRAVINQPGSSIPDWESLRDEVAAHADVQHAALAPTPPVDEETAEPTSQLDPELLDIFLDEAGELSEAMERDFAAWQSNANELEAVARLQRHLHTLKGGARMAGVSVVGDLSHAMESLFESVVEGRVSVQAALHELVRHALDGTADQLDRLFAGEMPDARQDLIERLEQAARGEAWQPLDTTATSWVAEEAPSEALAAPEAESESPVADPSQPAAIELDAGLEGEVPETKLLDSVSEPDLESEAEAGPEFEAEVGPKSETEPAIDEQDAEPELKPGPTIDGLITDDDSFSPSAPKAPDFSESESFDLGGFGSDFAQPAAQEPEAPRFVRGEHPPEEELKPVDTQEQVRVRTALLDDIVSDAGEVSIYRARLEQQNKELGFDLEELSQTIERLRGQLRHLEIETEAQMLSRHQRDLDQQTEGGFDPLELDRYSNIQQLSRALSETVEDLSSIGGNLVDTAAETNALLSEQDRVANELQDGLLRARMVLLSSRTARLQRLVRQTAHSLGKQAELDVVGGDGEIDRVILERMMAPFEHLLRNSVAHGIESPEQRVAAGKDAKGRISLNMQREGSEVCLRIADDGKGLDRDAIRAKAIERGLIEPDAELDGRALDSLILEAGFSTADAVSQIAGRGVGMDVVVSEIKQLGGSLDIYSEPGLGASFEIRLPFTLAITEALLVKAGEDVYAVPYGSLEGIARIGLEQLESCYHGLSNLFEYGGHDYEVRYLARMLHGDSPQLRERARWVPLLLVRSGDQRVAIHVDELLGRRQVVVKSLGVQLSTVRWFTGGTILANGDVALILDTHALVRHATALPQNLVLDGLWEAEAARRLRILVVDDSITVRKVTSRLLARHDMQVATARDGIEALAKLPEQKPDVVLLDIEMPRMDGFEVARQMRSSDEFAHIPIIMITSRTGDKHRELALSLGVKAYLGKPYQEAELIDKIQQVAAGDPL